jgi:hypothetical protein
VDFASLCSLPCLLARYYSRSLFYSFRPSRSRHATGSRGSRRGTRVRLSHQPVRDVREWIRFSSELTQSRPIHPVLGEAILRTDAADVGWGGTFGLGRGVLGMPGESESQGIWDWHDGADCISVRELRAVRLTLEQLSVQGALPARARQEPPLMLRCALDNQSCVYVLRTMMAAAPSMMLELTLLKGLLGKLRICIAETEWLPSALNRHADGLSRKFRVGGLEVLQKLRNVVVAGMQQTFDNFPLRPLGEHPVLLAKRTLAELRSAWFPTDPVRLICPPVPAISVVLAKLQQTCARAVLLVPDWPRQPWHATALAMSSRTTLLPEPPEQAWRSTNTLNPQWRLLMVELNL